MTDNDLMDILKELDENIDFARGEIQWKIVLFLSQRGASTISEISKGVGINKKASIDSIRKLITKGLVEKIKYDIYDLSPAGRTLLGKLLSLSTVMSPTNGSGVDPSEKVVEVKPQDELDGELDIMHNLNHYYYFVEIGKAAMVNDGKVPLTALSKELGVSKRTIINYLEILATRYKFFKKINKRSISGLRVEWIITEDGKKVLGKIPGIYKMRNNIFLKFILKSTVSTRLDYAIFKLLIAFSIISPVIFYFYKNPLDHIVATIWLYFLVFYVLASVMAFIGTRK
ncbi:HTH-type transcriptional activator ArnR1 [Metallosphaera sp. J1]|uniref:HTH domain-containing protein n=1 Tax=Metallosphaera javensis (ex Hofmann et al. 2022) TaxID=99938 RepID=UPI001EDCF0D3|nr:HTH domain-containing protein [Metallosphaera javensis (ex Hofmann et al. 2022)]MCG3110143.1 HTH-type transcriptional activator ArnR1 [Metallosphaera javensis (ex Hofmann et al. 2022)]